VTPGESVVSVVLLPNPADSAQLVDCSQLIHERTNSLIRLSDQFLPHISVAQFTAPAEEAAALWEQVRHLSAHVSELESAGLSFVPDAHEDGLWIELGFLRSTAASELQAQIIQSDFARQFKLHNHAGDSWRPHVTVGLVPGHSIPALNLAKLTIFKRSFQNLTLAVGINGEYWTFVETRFS